MGVIVWYFTSDMKKALGTAIDRLDQDVQKMNTRVSRLEGTVYGAKIYEEIKDEK